MDKEPIRERLQAIYEKLLDTYGPQHWWPAEEPFEVMVGAILTQSTAWRNVEKAINNLKIAGALSPERLHQLNQSEIAALIYPSGYFNVKAAKIKAMVEWLRVFAQDDPKNLCKIDTYELRMQLLDVWGIGEETADSIILYAANKPIFVIDAYTRRIIDRIGIEVEGKSYTDYQKIFMNNLSTDAGLFNEYHALLVCHGKNTCNKQPNCRQCCLREICNTGNEFDGVNKVG